MKNRIARVTLMSAIGLIAACVVLLISGSRSGQLTLKLPVEHTAEFADEHLPLFPSPLHVRGHQLVNSADEVVLLRGVMPPDPAVLDERGRFNRDFFSRIRRTNSNVIRLPVHPEEWVGDRDYLWRYLDPLVSWAGDLGMYVVIDWHYIGNVATGAGSQMPDLDRQPKELTLEFWRLIASHFRATPHVIFEIFNEPASITAADWRRQAAQIVAVIRDAGAGQLVIVGGIEYGRDLSWVASEPLSDGNLAYAAHIYPVHSRTGWPNWFGGVAERYPVLITEWGFIETSAAAETSYLVGNRANYGEPFLEYLGALEIGWIACWYDDNWLPPMLAKDGQGYTPYGDFIVQQLKAGQ